MCKNFQFFKIRELQISQTIKKGDIDSASQLIDDYVQERLQYFAARQGRFYRDLLHKAGSNARSAALRSSTQGKSISHQTATKLNDGRVLPTFPSLSKLMAERDRDVVIIFDPFEGTEKKRVWVSFSAQDSVSYSVASLLRGVLRSQTDHADKKVTARLAGLSENTLRQAEKRQGHPLFDEHIVCHSVETVCRIAAANQYRMSILFYRSHSNEERLS